MKKPLISLVVAVLFVFSTEAWSQQGPPGGKGPPGGGRGGGQGGPPGGGQGGPPGGGGGQKGGPPGGGQKGGSQRGGGSSGRLVGSSSYRQVDRSRSPLEQIQSALSLVRLKRELRPEHYEKLTSSLVVAAGTSTASEPLNRLSRRVADLVSKHRLGYFESRDLATVLHDALRPQTPSEDRLNLTAKYTRTAFRKTDATAEELELITESLREYHAASRPLPQGGPRPPRRDASPIP